MNDWIRVTLHPLQVFAERKMDGNWRKPIIFVFLTFLAVCVFPAVNDAGHPVKLAADLAQLLLLVLGSYPLVCLAFLLAGRMLRSPVRYQSIFVTWGYSYLPIFLLWVLVVISRIAFPSGTPIFAAGIPGMLITSLMGLLFLWKLLFYFVELQAVLGLSLWRMLIASILLGALFIVYYVFVGTVFGLRIPIV